jgi:hypothetical protein
MAIAALALPLLAILAVDSPEPRLTVVVTSAAPVDPQRLADALRAYLDQRGVDVQGSDAGAAPDDLRRQLSEARRIGEAARALAVVRAAAGSAGEIELELVDLATDKALLADVPRPARDEDLYRTLALKIQALLRATLSEAPEKVAATPRLAGLIAPPPAAAVTAPAAAPAPAPGGPPRLALETGYSLVAFPLAPLALHGLGVNVAFAPRPWLELALGSAGLASGRTEGRAAALTATVVPLTAAARVRFPFRRVDLLVGPSVTAAYVGVSPSSATTAVRSTHDVLPAAGGDAEVRLRVGAGTWLFARVAALGVLLGAGYRVDGQLLLDTSRLVVAGGAGIGVGLW